MANAGCINAIGFDGTYLRTLDTLDSANIGVGVQYCIPAPLDDKRLDYIKYTDKCGCTCCITGENEILVYATNGVIKNFTLTNDDTNEKVNVKWNDLFGSNRAYTMVRYKTGSYPTSISDGTLAVKETTQNQYSVSGCNVSGLTDGTTYYFTAFAVSQDGTIIVVQNKSITPDYKRKPDANTIAYYPLNSTTQLQDMSGNNRHLDYKANVTFSATDVYMNGSNSILSKNSSILTGDPIYTIARSRKVSAINNNRKEFFSLMRDTGSYRGPLLSVRGSTIYLDYNGLVGGTFNFTVQANRWYRAVFLHTASRVNTLYIDGVNIGTITMSSNQNLYGNQMHIGSEKDNTSVFYGYLKNYIFESGIYTAEQIAYDYRKFPNT